MRTPPMGRAFLDGIELSARIHVLRSPDLSPKPSSQVNAKKTTGDLIRIGGNDYEHLAGGSF